jgi:hypothetical protein
MIQSIEVLMVGPGFYLVTAIMIDEPPVQLGLFESKDEIDRAVELFSEQFKNKLN